MIALRKTHVVQILAELTPIALPFIFLPLALFLLLSAMAASAAEVPLGESVRHNVMVQTANPQPQYLGTPVPGGIGLRSVTATRRYVTGKIQPLIGAGMDSAVGQQGGAGASSSGSTVSGAGK